MNKREAQILSDKVITCLIAERKKKGVSCYRLSLDTGLSKGSLSYIENFEQKPSLYTLMIIADYLQVDLGKIISEVMDKSR